MPLNVGPTVLRGTLAKIHLSIYVPNQILSHIHPEAHPSGGGPHPLSPENGAELLNHHTILGHPSCQGEDKGIIVIITFAFLSGYG